MGSLLTLAVEGPSVIAPTGGWFLENAWIIPLLPAISFVLILFFGKRMPNKGSEIGIAAVAIAFVLAVLTAGQWINQVDTAEDRAPHDTEDHADEDDHGEEALGSEIELAAGEDLVLPAVEEGGEDGGQHFAGTFLAAGAGCVLSSAANLDEEATRLLVARLLEELARPGVPPGEALRRARAAIARDPRFGHPFFHGLLQASGRALD